MNKKFKYAVIDEDNITLVPNFKHRQSIGFSVYEIVRQTSKFIVVRELLVEISNDVDMSEVDNDFKYETISIRKCLFWGKKIELIKRWTWVVLKKRGPLTKIYLKNYRVHERF